MICYQLADLANIGDLHKGAGFFEPHKREASIPKGAMLAFRAGRDDSILELLEDSQFDCPFPDGQREQQWALGRAQEQRDLVELKAWSQSLPLCLHDRVVERRYRRATRGS